MGNGVRFAEPPDITCFTRSKFYT